MTAVIMDALVAGAYATSQALCATASWGIDTGDVCVGVWVCPDSAPERAEFYADPATVPGDDWVLEDD